MEEIANFFTKIVIEEKNQKSNIIEFRKKFDKICYTF